MNVPQEPWYKTAFQADYLERYAHRDFEEAAQIFQLMNRRVKLSREEYYLDLCCGAGRHTQVFCEKGYQIVGLDLSEDLLYSASQQSCQKARYVRADMRFHPFVENSFEGVLHLFTAFGYFTEDDQNEEVFREVHRILKPGGWYMFDFLNASHVRAQLSTTPTIITETHETLGRLTTEKRLTENGHRVQKRVEFLDSPTPRFFQEDVALYDAQQLRAMLQRSGFILQEVLGSYEGESFSDTSARWIALCRKANSKS